MPVRSNCLLAMTCPRRSPSFTRRVVSRCAAPHEPEGNAARSSRCTVVVSAPIANDNHRCTRSHRLTVLLISRSIVAVVVLTAVAAGASKVARDRDARNAQPPRSSSLAPPWPVCGVVVPACCGPAPINGSANREQASNAFNSHTVYRSSVFVPPCLSSRTSMPQKLYCARASRLGC